MDESKVLIRFTLPVQQMPFVVFPLHVVSVRKERESPGKLGTNMWYVNNFLSLGITMSTLGNPSKLIHNPRISLPETPFPITVSISGPTESQATGYR